MLTLLEVRQPSSDPTRPDVELARLDLTDNTEGERVEVLANAKILYPDCLYFWHQCGHDEAKACVMTEA